MVLNKFEINTSPHLEKSDGGFTLIELTAVVVILGVLGSLGIGNINRWTKLSKIDQAMSVLSNSLVECLQTTRGGTDPTTVGPPAGVIDNNRLESSGYKIKALKDKCSEFFITPINDNEKLLFEMGYQITADSQVTKIATPADNESSLIRCKRWGGPNCGASEEQKAAWAAAAALAAQKKLCNDNFYIWLNDTPPNGGIGSFNRWDETANSCTLNTFAFEGSIVANQAAVDAAQEAKLGAICNAAVVAQKNLNPPPSEIKTLDECPGKTFYFCLGEDKQTEVAMQTCIAANKEQVCIANTEQKRQAGYAGKWGPNNGQDLGPGKCNDVYWMCNQVLYSSEAEFNSSTCFNPGNGGGNGNGNGNGSCQYADENGQTAATPKLEDCLCKESRRKRTVNFCNGAGGGEAVPGHPGCDDFYSCMNQ